MPKKMETWQIIVLILLAVIIIIIGILFAFNQGVFGSLSTVELPSAEPIKNYIT